MKLLKQTAMLGLSALVVSSSVVGPLEIALGNQPANDEPTVDELTRMLSRIPNQPTPQMSPEEAAHYQEAYKASWERALRQQSKHTRLSFLKNMLVPKWFRQEDASAAMAKSIPLSPVTQPNTSLVFDVETLEEANAAQQPNKLVPANPAMEEMRETLARIIEKNTPPVTETIGQNADAIKAMGEELTRQVKAAVQAADEKSLVVVAAAPSSEMTIPAPLKDEGEVFTLLSSGLEGLQELDGPAVRPSVPKAPWAPQGNSAAPTVLASASDSVVLKSGISQNMSSLDLTMGKARVLNLSKPAARVSISDPDVASAVVISPTQIQLVGKKVGVANLLVWSDMNTANHTVVDINVHRDVSVLVRQLQFVDPGIQIVPMAAEDTVILTGEARSRESAQLAVEIAKAYFAKGGGGGGIAGALAGGQQQGSSNVSSNAPGSAIPGSSTNLINLIKVTGEPSTKLELARKRLQEIDPNIGVEVVPGSDGSEKIVLTGRVLNANIAAKALNLAAVFYGQPGVKVVSGPGGNFPQPLASNGGGGSSSSGSSGGGGGQGGMMGMLSNAGGGGRSQTASANILQGAIVTDASGNVISLMEIAQKPQIRCTVKFLEIQKTGLDAIGATFTGASGNSSLASLSGSQSAPTSKPLSSLAPNGSAVSLSSAAANNMVSTLAQGINNGATQVLTLGNQFQATIQMLEEKRMARTLAEPTLTMLSGEQSSFLAGGEVPIPMIGGNGQIEVEYHEVGIRLNMAASVTDEGKIHLEVEPEVSAVDQAYGISTNFGALPGFKTRRTHSTVQIQPGQSFVMAGLFNQEDVDSISGLPGVSKLPVIGNLFRNKWSDRRKTELVVIIQPEVLMNPDAGLAETPKAQPKPYKASR